MFWSSPGSKKSNDVDRKGQRMTNHILFQYQIAIRRDECDTLSPTLSPLAGLPLFGVRFRRPREAITRTFQSNGIIPNDSRDAVEVGVKARQVRQLMALHDGHDQGIARQQAKLNSKIGRVRNVLAVNS